MGESNWHRVALIHLTMVVVQIIFSVNQIASKVGTNYFHPSVLIFLRCALVSPFMFMLAKIKEKDILPKNRREVLLLIGMGAFSTVSFETFIFGVKLTSVATGTTLQATSPLWTLLIALALKMEGPSAMKIIGVICAILGAAISVAGANILRKLFGYGPEQDIPGSEKSDFPEGLLLIANAIFYSGFVTMQKITLNTVKPLTATAWNIFITAIFVMFIALFFIDTLDLGAVTLEGWLALLYVSLFSMGIAYTLLSWVAKQTSTSVIAVYSTVMPVLAPIVSYFYLGEHVTLMQLIGMGVTLSGVFLVIRARYVEERQNRIRALQTVTGVSVDDDDVAKANSVSVVLAKDEDTSALLGEERRKENEEVIRDGFASDEDRSALLAEERGRESEDAGEEGGVEMEVKGKRGKGGYAVVMDQDVELQEVN